MVAERGVVVEEKGDVIANGEGVLGEGELGMGGGVPECGGRCVWIYLTINIWLLNEVFPHLIILFPIELQQCFRKTPSSVLEFYDCQKS